MPYTMTHLIIADKVKNKLCKSNISLPQYYLGSIAPDAVHNRPGYISDWKKDSHLLLGDEEWGFMTNHENVKIM